MQDGITETKHIAYAAINLTKQTLGTVEVGECAEHALDLKRNDEKYEKPSPHWTTQTSRITQPDRARTKQGSLQLKNRNPDSGS